ncbi:RNA polymerase sigma-70 factor (ECF subfamily) [Saccharopolyspora lacisalsi]|uniref:RNA polymerase sigma-70 factor (ECF subfamily) n=1 Tax=Halosaccharopolyspora lacisalsi TaxID=1000566 RepID=A0A839E7P0_9PSEU|nr:RNA polymerase sigma factor SigM [Halosaccharopolyspora lacisalsi]MBA8827717.1 RNA polymerase sigma-70 factor (ECF subfamily) [Halosaccharopolyspora lacisalsi]
MSVPVSSDADLLAAHNRGDPHAFGELFSRHRDRLWAVALRTLRDREDAADALQEAMISAFRNAASFRAESQVGTWLHRIVVNACLDRIRRRQSRPTVPLADEGPREPAAPRDDFADSDTRMAVQDAIASLPEDQRAAIVLVDIEGYPVSEVAGMLAIADGTVKSRCARGRVRLAQLLGHLRNPSANANVPVDEMDARRREGR